jgi:hypothetical protein
VNVFLIEDLLFQQAIFLFPMMLSRTSTQVGLPRSRYGRQACLRAAQLPLMVEDQEDIEAGGVEGYGAD